MSKGQSLQDPFLNGLRREKVPVAIYLVNGIKLQGQVESFDNFVILLKNTVSQMVYKHAVSTIVPARNVKLTGANGANGSNDSHHNNNGGHNDASNDLMSNNLSGNMSGPMSSGSSDFDEYYNDHDKYNTY